jgi:hypothetical protein
VTISVLNGRARFSFGKIYADRPPPRQNKVNQVLFEENEFLNLSYPRVGVPDPNVRFYEWKSVKYRDDSTSNTREKIMAYGDTFIFYLCRELIRFELMYFILRSPRGNSSLCTHVFMFVRPGEVSAKAARRAHWLRGNSGATSAIQSTLPNDTPYSTSRFGQNIANQVSHNSDSWSNQSVGPGDYSANDIKLDPHSQISSIHANIKPGPDYNPQVGPQIPYKHTQSTLQSHGQEFSAVDPTYLAAGHPIHPQQSSPNDNFQIFSPTTRVNARFNQIHQFEYLAAAHSKSRFGQNTANQMSHNSDSGSNQPVGPGDSSAYEIEPDPHSQPSNRHANIGENPDYYPLHPQIPYQHTHSTPYSHGEDFSADHRTYLEAGHPRNRQQSSPNDNFQIFSTTKRGNARFNQIHQFDNNMDNQPVSIQYSNMLAPIDVSGDDSGYYQDYPASQASASNPGQYGRFFDPINNPLEISSHQSFQNAYNGQLPTQHAYQLAGAETTKQRRNDMPDDDFDS